MKYIFLLFPILCFAETPEEINDRINEIFWGSRNACYITAVSKKIEFDQAGYTSRIVIVNTGRGYKHAMVSYQGMCYDDLQGVTVGVNPCKDVHRLYPLVRYEN